MTKVDYEMLEREFISTRISRRKLAEKYDISFSTVADYGRAHDWDEKRRAFRAKVTEKVIDRDARKLVSDLEDLEYEQIQAARAIIFAGLQSIRAGDVVVQPRDITLAIDKLQLLTGKATERTEATVVGTAVSVGPDPEFLRRLEELSRGARDDAPRLARLRIEGSKPN